MMAKGDYNVLVNDCEREMTILDFKKANPTVYKVLNENNFYKESTAKARFSNTINKFESMSFIITKFTENTVYYYFNNEKIEGEEAQSYFRINKINRYRDIEFFDESSEDFRIRF